MMPTEYLIQYGFAGVIVAVMLGYTLLLRKDNMALQKQLVELTERHADRIERITTEFIEHVKANTAVLARLEKRLNGRPPEQEAES